MLTFAEWILLKESRQGREGKNKRDYNHGKSGWIGGNMRYSGKQGKGNSSNVEKNRASEEQQFRRELGQND